MMPLQNLIIDNNYLAQSGSIDSAGRVTEEDAGSVRRSYSYDSYGRTDTMRVDYGRAELCHSYTYTYDGQPKTERITCDRADLPVVDRLWRYDKSGRLQEIWTDCGRGYVSGNGMRYSYPYDSIGGIRNVYDGAGRIVSQNFGDRIERKYCYDTDGSLRSATTSGRPLITLSPGVPFRASNAFNLEPVPEVTFILDPFNDKNMRLPRLVVAGDTLERHPSGRISTRRGGGTEQSYVYDVYGRLITASAHQASDPEASYSSEYEYDSNGNIIEASYHGVTDRVGEALIYGEKSRLSYKHSGNRMTGIESEYLGETYEGVSGIAETGTFELSYDSRGNVISDESCGISSAVYNHLNQPVEIRTSAESIKFTYDNTGGLLSREYNDYESGSLRKQEFIGPYELCGDSLAAVHFEGGYFDSRGKVYYHIADYQGNVSSVMCGNGQVVQKASYYPYGEPWLEPEGDNRRLYGGKERLNFGPLRHSDYGPRLLDTRSGRWNSQDPCAEEFYPYSPYSVCFGDPINFTDPDGCRPSVIEAIMMAKYSYPDNQNPDNGILNILRESGWYLSVLNSVYNMTKSNFSDLEATIFVRNTGNGEHEYACVFAGTHDLDGWLSNGAQLFGQSKEYKDCVEFSKNLSNEISGEDLTFIGHSQGGGKAAAASMATNRAAITFNPAAISELTKKTLNLGMANNIVNYIICGYLVDKGFRVGGDPVHNFQKNFLRLTPPGRIEYIYPTFFLRHGIDNF